jgi:hypothetical protein
VQNLKKKLADYIRRHPEESYAVMSAKLGISVTNLCRTARESGLARREPRSIVVDAELLAKLEGNHA